MQRTINGNLIRNHQRGMTLYTVAVMLFILLGVGALALDLGMLYVTRSEAQRAADSAALAGAKKFIEAGYLSGLGSQATAENLAREEAKAVGGQNVVGGQLAQVLNEDVTFPASPTGNPWITVIVQRTAARGNAVPTFLAKAMGIFQADVSATATAEAYTSSGGNLPVGTSCVKPWLLPNCDPSHTTPGNPNCPGSAYFVDPSTGQVANPGPFSSGGVIGEQLLLKPGSPGAAPAPSQFYPVQIPPGEEPAICPPCAQNTGSTGPGAALYEKNISCCNTNVLYCGQNINLDRQTGNMVGPTRQGVQCLIHQQTNSCAGSASGCGQDFLENTTTFPLPIIGGTNNPNPLLVGQRISSSDNIVTIPLYDGHNPCPGGAATCGTATIVGFLQVFVEKAGPPQATVTGYVMNVAGCGGGSGGGTGGSGSGGLTGPGGSLFPIRLIRPTT